MAAGEVMTKRYGAIAYRDDKGQFGDIRPMRPETDPNSGMTFFARYLCQLRKKQLQEELERQAVDMAAGQ